MTREWPQAAIGEVAEIFDGPHATPRTVNTGPIFLGIGALQNGRINLGETRHVTPEDFRTWTRRVKPQSGDVVFSYETRLGEAAMIPPGLECCLGRRMGLVRANRARLDPRFFLYVYLSPTLQEFIRSRTIPGATVDRIALKEFPSFLIPVPALHEQRRIASILGALDDKIDLNRRMNETLEAMTRAIFKDWFVDFGPTRAKMESRPPYLAPDIWGLFPNILEVSKMGEVPTGWRVAAVRELTRSIQYGLTQSAKLQKVGPKFLRITDIQGGKIDWSKVPFCEVTPEEHERYRLRSGDILVARTGASTGENVYLPTAREAVFASYLVRFQFSDLCTARLVAVFMRSAAYFDYVAGCVGGSAQPNASAQLLAGASLVYPTPDIARVFYEIVSAFDEQIEANNTSSETLAATRDLLLPKLMSGEVHIRDAERALEAVA